MATSAQAGTPGRDPRGLIFKASQGDEGYMVFQVSAPGAPAYPNQGLGGGVGGGYPVPG